MGTLVDKLGIDPKLLAAQGANFLILLAVLRFTVYKPLLAMLKKRRDTIATGLARAEEAERRLDEVEELQKEKLKEASHKGLEIVRAAKEQADSDAHAILGAAAAKEEEILQRAREKAESERTHAQEEISREAAELVGSILAARVGLSPEAVDSALIERAAREIRIAQKK